MFTTLFSDPVSQVLALLAVTLVAVYLLLRLWQGLRQTSAQKTPESWILIDGSNVMHWQDNTPQLAPVRLVVDHLKSLGYVPGVVFDANAGWKLMGRYLHDGDFARLLGVEKRQVLVVPKGTQADPFLLKTAREFGDRIVTNDRFRDWAEAHPKVKEPGFLIRGEMREGKVYLKGVRGVVGAEKPAQ
jgi:Zc3h12a-like Ribonuclease NYN domain